MTEIFHSGKHVKAFSVCLRKGGRRGRRREVGGEGGREGGREGREEGSELTIRTS